MVSGAIWELYSLMWTKGGMGFRVRKGVMEKWIHNPKPKLKRLLITLLRIPRNGLIGVTLIISRVIIPVINIF